MCLVPSMCWPRCEGQRPLLPTPRPPQAFLIFKILLLNTQVDKQGQNDHPHFSDRDTHSEAKPEHKAGIPLIQTPAQWKARPYQCA